MRCLFAVVISLFLLTEHGNAQITYTLKDLGTLGGSTSAANAINNDARVAGGSYLPLDEAYNAFITDPDGEMPRALGTLGGTTSDGRGITSDGRVAGSSTISGGANRAFLSAANGGMLVNLGTLGGANSYGYAVNNFGQVAGSSQPAGSGFEHAFLSDPNGGALKDLGTLTGGSISQAFAVNAIGQVAGQSNSSSGLRAFISDPNGGALRSLGTLGGTVSTAAGINDVGQVVGRAALATAGVQHAFRSAPNGGALLDLGTLGGPFSVGLGINNVGMVVGYSRLSDNATLHGFVYIDGRGMLNLNSLVQNSGGWIVEEARAINDFGEIAGVGDFNGVKHAILLTPVMPDVRVTSITRLEGGYIRVEGVGVPGQAHTVHVTGDLANAFGPLTTVMATASGYLRFDDLEAPGSTKRFYRFSYP